MSAPHSRWGNRVRSRISKPTEVNPLASARRTPRTLLILALTAHPSGCNTQGYMKDTATARASTAAGTLLWTRLFLLAVCLCPTTRLVAAPDSVTTPDRVFFNAKIFTAAPNRPYAEAIAIRGSTILACGTKAEAVAASRSGPELVDLQGRTLLPGFIDSHMHPIASGPTLTGTDVGERVETVEKLADFVTEAKRTGRGMRGDILEITGVPLRFWSKNAELNAKFNAEPFATTPVILRGMDYHTVWANVPMRRRAGVTREFILTLTESQRKYYGLDDQLEPNGFGVDAGVERIDATLPPISDEALLKGGDAAVRYFNRSGITAWLEPVWDTNVLRIYQGLSERGQLTARAAAFPRVDPHQDVLSELRRVQELRKAFWGVTNLTIPGIKVYADGVAESPSQSAAMLSPYRNSGLSGELLFDPARFADLCIAADRNDLMIHVHAIGDRAVRETLNGIGAARQANGPSHRPHTITHLQWIDPADFARFAELGVIASFQLYWASANPDAIDLVQPYVAPAIYPWQYAARALLHAGATIAGASDWSVSTPNVFEAIYQAETRRGPKGVLNAEQSMPREAMLLAYTRHAARALGLSDRIGSLEPGKKADMILLDRDVLVVPPEAMKETRVLWTMFNGEFVYRSAE